MNAEWRRRIERYKDELECHFYKKIKTLDLEGFFTYDRLSYEEALSGDFKDISRGTSWGSKWEYGWFRTSFEIEDTYDNELIAFKSGTNGEQIIFVNGNAKGSIDKFHHHLPLIRENNNKYEIYIESYAGHGNRNGHVGPNPEDRISVT